MQFNNLPLYYLDVDNETEGVQIMSLVNQPAVEVNYLTFSADKDKLVKFSTEDEKHILNGVALIPEFPIYRVSPSGEEYYVSFTKEAIERIVEKFFQDKNNTNINLDHSEMVDSCVIFESYLINHKRGICPVEFEDYPDGTWVISTKINSQQLWMDIKAGKYNGYSVEGFLKVLDVPNKFSKQAKKTISNLKDLFEWLNDNK